MFNAILKRFGHRVFQMWVQMLVLDRWISFGIANRYMTSYEFICISILGYLIITCFNCSFKHCELWCKRTPRFYKYDPFSLSNVFLWDRVFCSWYIFPIFMQPMLQELGKQNPHLMRLIQDHQADFLRLINEPVEGEGYWLLCLCWCFCSNAWSHPCQSFWIRNLLSQLASAMPPTVSVTPEEREAIERVCLLIPSPFWTGRFHLVETIDLWNGNCN